VKGTAFIIAGGNRKFTALNFPRLCPFVLLVKIEIGWRQGRTLGSEDGKLMGSGLLECAAAERN
jgi:hypothetical protein